MNNDRRPTPDERGAWLRAARIAAGYTVQADFARALDVDKSLLSNYETGKSRPSDETATRIAGLLQRSVIDVRRNLGLWVPDDGEGESAQADHEAAMRRLAEAAEDLLAEARRIAEERDGQRGA